MEMNNVFKNSFREIKILSANTEGIINISGISDTRSAFLASLILSSKKGNALILVRSYERAKRFAQDLSCFYDGKIHILPEETGTWMQYEAKSRWMLEEKFIAVNDFIRMDRCTAIVPITTAAAKMASPEQFTRNIIKLEPGDELVIDDFKQAMLEMGYERTSLTEAKGKYSIRGDIIDIFPPDAEWPYRIELYDTEVDDIRSFDPATQRSIDKIESIEIFPANDSETSDKNSFIWDYLKSGDTIIIDDYSRITNSMELVLREYSEGLQKVSPEKGKTSSELPFALLDDLTDAFKGKLTVAMTPFRGSLKGIESLIGAADLNSSQAPAFNGRVDMFLEEVKSNRKRKIHTLIYCPTQERKEIILDFLVRNECESYADVIVGELSSGMIFSSEQIAIYTESEIFNSIKKRTPRKRRKRDSGNSQQIKSFVDVKPGDYVVHEHHGIGRFEGINQLEVQGVIRDYIKIRYAGEDVLYVPVEQMDLVQSYIGGGGAAPRVNKLNSGEWNKTKAKAKQAIENMAKELLQLSAERFMEDGFAFSPDTVWQSEFEGAFPHVETDDQLKCSEQIKQEMEMPMPMDHLLCGDVGYGKTEVAARAIFKCVMDGKQAAVLVPTTILANQHYHTFLDRFGKFPCNVDLLCRFRTDAQQQTTIDRLSEGKVDIVVGTHRLLSKDVKFKDLGLLVIDEEQRFGVQDKEKLKQLKKNVDVLTLSATPIPRTLHMSLVGVRNMSLIEEPPEERYPVQTFVLEQSEDIIAEVVERELAREGQVFIVYNRVKGIRAIGDMITRLVPDARVEVAHGQMNEHSLEEIMVRFVDHEFDVLVATTIIESGIDITNANTMIILDADRFGLTQLYQLRGRVGRADKMAYAYLMYHKDKVLSEVARNRLSAIREFTEFGSGFKIAMRDLEIRGAGNLLGTEQSGHMASIGYEMYCKLIDETVRTLKGQKVADEPLETLIEINVDAYIPDPYIPQEPLKLEMYKRIAGIESRDDISDVTDELIDRFGDVPSQTISLMKISYCKHLGQSTGASRIFKNRDSLICEFYPKNGITADCIIKLSQKYGMAITVNNGRKPYLGIKVKEQKKIADELVDFLEDIRDTSA